MAYLVLARKYRPQKFADVAGQDHVTRTLLNALQQERIAHGYIFSGHRGIGKTTIARILAQALNCRTPKGSAQRPTPEPCGVCESCVEIRAGNSVDVIEIDAATNRGIDEIRELREAARYRPARDRYKIYILDEAHQITDAAFNALLKTLEEPPDHIIFMMATTQPEDIPQTIRSRCQHFSFHAVAFDDIVTQLTKIASEEGIAASEEAIGLLAEAGDGSMRDALSIMDQAIASAALNADGRAALNAEQIRDLMGSVPNAVFEQLLEAVSSGSSADVLREANRLLNAGHSPQQLARQMVRYLRNALMSKIAGDDSDLLQISGDECARASRTAMLFGEEDLTRFLNIMLRTFDELGYRQEQRLHFELGLLKLVHAQRLLPLEEMLSSAAATPSARSVAPRLQPSPPAPAAPPQRISPPSPPAPAPRSVAPQPQEQPGFSPFEADRRRKETMAHASPAISSRATVQPTAGALALAEEPETIAPQLPETLTDATPEPQPAEPTPAEMEIAAEAPPAGAGSPDISAEQLRDAVVAALTDAGQASAALKLASSEWRAGENEWRVAVPCVEKSLPMFAGPDVRRIAESIVRNGGYSPARIAFSASGKSLAPQPAAPARAVIASDGVRAEAMKNPLVQKAQELFNAEVRQVIDHRGKK